MNSSGYPMRMGLYLLLHLHMLLLPLPPQRQQMESPPDTHLLLPRPPLRLKREWRTMRMGKYKRQFGGVRSNLEGFSLLASDLFDLFVRPTLE